MAPYRKPTEAVGHVCIVCYRFASVRPAICPTCPAPMAPVNDESVAKLREMAEKARARPELRRYAWSFGLAAVVAVGAFVALLGTGLYDCGTSARLPTNGIGEAWPLFALWIVFAVAFAWVAQKVWGPPKTPRFDPLEATPTELVRFLRIRVIDQR